ncbi:MAG: 4Fe-4S ferredoxin, partial [Planctomycetes bacterium]|nr:4Fe-4S ferredoxin [Planctomycetota bacterium]
DFHNRLLKDHSIAVGCPKLDNVEFYIEKVAAIQKANKLNSLTVVHMEVPCCSGLTHVARQGIARSGAKMTFEDITIDLRGNVSKVSKVED